ncbi:MAG TPA: UDP-N-acetylmuramoyl-L-alanyl-D-glutamate--2,6-diaminopimelate ligase [Acidimicrobiales bacterium]|nr:UDP-N-acetylmuramoyl-L-alanyl-D-glutamate--2,6-diaminopimelate ligase [Acidimicrobiales bacterium]
MDRLFEGVEVTGTRGDPAGTEVTSIEFDSRVVTPGALFFCLPGHRTDGHDYAAVAVDAGAVGLMVERPLESAVPQVVVAPGSARRAMARVACTFYDNPAGSLTTVGVTGTNGKTTVTHLLASILDTHGTPCAVIGTLDGARTTPEAPVVQKILDEARRHGRAAAAMEVSSHALAEARVDGIRFDAAVFTNLSHDHLDYHGTMEAYFEAKASLFTEDRAALAVVNVDDLWGRRLLDRLTIPSVTFCATDATDVDAGPGRTTFVWRGRKVELSLTGAYHVANALAAATAAAALGVPEDTVVRGLERARPVPGRFELIDAPAPFTVVVDYAHTPGGLAVALDSARLLAGGHRVVCVFGCGGDRDHAKRPLMGRVASDRADVTVITSDNPRHEDPAAIIDDVRAGVVDDALVVVEPDRAAAIGRAVELAEPGDVVLVAGKGHESVIEIDGRRTPFDDRQVASAAVRRLGLTGGPREMAP